jgi:ABC-type sulfate/molybdate transport systems ATPase subunit
MNGAGGGVVDVAAFALRLACLMLRRPKGRRLLVLDEAFRFLSERKEYRNRVRDLLVSLSEEMQVQVVLVTHDPVLEVGKVVEIG